LINPVIKFKYLMISPVRSVNSEQKAHDMIDLQNIGKWIIRNPLVIIALAVLLTLTSIHFAQDIPSEGMTTESFVSKDSALYQLYDHLYLENFGSDGNIILIEGDDVARAEVLEAELRLSDHMKKVEHVLGVQSIADIVADAEYRSNGTRSIPSQERIDEILSSSGQVVQALMPDRKHSRMIVGMPTTATLNSEQRDKLLQELTKAVDFSEFPAGYGVVITGDPSFQKAILELSNSSNNSILALCGVLMIVALLLFFRHVRWPLLPLPVVILGIIWTFGAMGLLQIPMGMTTFAAFPIMIGIGVDYAIQFHNRMNEELGKGEPLVQAVMSTVNHVAIPVAVALIVTEAGFISLLSSTVPSIKDFGKMCIIGLVMCYLAALFVNVTALYLGERKFPKYKRGRVSEGGASTGAFIQRVAAFSMERWKAVLAVALLLALAGNYADTLVPIETDSKNYIPQDLPPLIDLRHMKDVFGGTESIQFIVQADDVTDPENLKWMDDFSNYLLVSREDRTEGAASIATYIKEANGGVLPDDKTSIRAIIDGLPSSVRDAYISGHDLAVIDVNIGDALTNLGTEGMERLVASYEDDLEWNTPPPGISVSITGDAVLMTTVMDALTSGRVEMSLLGLLFIFVLLFIIYRGDIIKALLPVLPMMVVIGWMGLVMLYGGLKYTPLTATLGALVLGVGSEYAILMMERFYEELAKVGDPYEAIQITANRIGSALVASGMTVIFGFGALIASPFNIISNFGVVTVMSVILALVTTFTVFVVLAIRMEIQREVIENARNEFKKTIAILNNQLLNNQSGRRSNGN